eukprot:8093039-Pyramimonas_sp.AAC.1
MRSRFTPPSPARRPLQALERGGWRTVWQRAVVGAEGDVVWTNGPSSERLTECLFLDGSSFMKRLRGL